MDMKRLRWERSKLADRRKAERRKNTIAARKWMGIERRVGERRSDQVEDSFEEYEEYSPNHTKQT
jgi:hypothetical protein